MTAVVLLSVFRGSQIFCESFQLTGKVSGGDEKFFIAVAVIEDVLTGWDDYFAKPGGEVVGSENVNMAGRLFGSPADGVLYDVQYIPVEVVASQPHRCADGHVVSFFCPKDSFLWQ